MCFFMNSDVFIKLDVNVIKCITFKDIFFREPSKKLFSYFGGSNSLYYLDQIVKIKLYIGRESTNLKHELEYIMRVLVLLEEK